MADEREDKVKKLDANAEHRYLDITFKAEKRERNGSEVRVITGRAIVFNKLSNLIGGWFKEKINSNALDGCDMSDVIACINHDPDKILARTSSGTLTLTIDAEGLIYEFECPNTSYGNDLWESVQRGDISKSSFQFVTEDSVWETLDGVDVRTVLKIRKLYDVAPVTWPAYDDTNVAKRSLDEWKEKQFGEAGGDKELREWKEKRERELGRISIY